MISEDELEILPKKLEEIARNINSEVLKKIGETVKKIGKLRPTETHKLQQILQTSNLDVKEISQMLAKYIDTSEDEIYKLYEEVAKKDYDFVEQFFKYKSIDYVPFERKESIQRNVKAIARQTANEYENLSNTTVFALKDYKGHVKYVPIEKAYKNIVDKAIMLVQNGASNYNVAMRDILKQYADSGIRKVEYDSCYSRRLDTAVRQNIIDGVKQINQLNQKVLGEEFGADGVEISVHGACAEDHLPVQGRQFTNEEYEKLQSNQVFEDYKGNKYSAIKRPITEWNCRHFAYSIVLGVSQPNHSDEELERIKRDNQKKIAINGKEYTKYEATQEQRKMETNIRREKDRYIMFRASGDEIMMNTARKNVTDLTRKYNEFSKQAGLKPRVERLKVDGYKKATNIN